MEAWLDILLLTFQLALFLLRRLCDDLSWYDLGIADEMNVFQGIGVAVFTISAIIKIVRKWEIPNIIKILFWKSQLKFIIPWALTILTIILFFQIFGCQKTSSHSSFSYFYVTYDGCCLNAVQIMLTNLNYTLICNTKAHLAELVVYKTVLFAQIIHNGFLLLMFVNTLDEKPKDYSIVFVSIAIANQVLIMDLIFRAAHQEREKQKQKQEQDQRRQQQQTKKQARKVTQQYLEQYLQSNLQHISPLKMKSSSPTKKNAAIKSQSPSKKYIDAQSQQQQKICGYRAQYLSRESSIIFHQSLTKKINTVEFLSSQKKKKFKNVQSLYLPNDRR